jgi:hypothetical protein
MHIYKRIYVPLVKSLSISLIKRQNEIILLHAHLHVMYFICFKFDQNPECGLGVALTRYDGQIDSYIHSNFVCGGIRNILGMSEAAILFSIHNYRDFKSIFLRNSIWICVDSQQTHNVETTLYSYVDSTLILSWIWKLKQRWNFNVEPTLLFNIDYTLTNGCFHVEFGLNKYDSLFPHRALFLHLVSFSKPY